MATSRLFKSRQGYPCLKRQKQESGWWISLKWSAVSRNSCGTALKWEGPPAFHDYLWLFTRERRVSHAKRSAASSIKWALANPGSTEGRAVESGARRLFPVGGVSAVYCRCSVNVASLDSLEIIPKL